MITRRKLLQYLPSVPLMGGVFGSALAKDSAAASTALKSVEYRDYFKELGVRTFINAAGTLTFLTGSLMREETMDAINYARDHYVGLDELQDKVGERLAQLLQAEYATVTSGCFAALTMGTAAVLAGMDREKVEALPNTSGIKKNEVIKLKGHTAGYAHAVANAGAKVIEVEDAAELERAINENTAMMFFIYTHNFDSPVRDDEFIAIAKKHNIPALIDIAADVPPVDNLWKHIRMGYDMVAISGGKALRGPQSAGILYGKRDLITAARLHAPPRGATIARGMKVNKEEILGMLVALNAFINTDHDKQWAEWESQIKHISDSVTQVPGVTTEVRVPEIANHVPTLSINWDPNVIKITPNEAKLALQQGHPSIETGGGRGGLSVTTFMMKPTEVPVVATRIREVLSQAAA